jgi:hypothetical protein
MIKAFLVPSGFQGGWLQKICFSYLPGYPKKCALEASALCLLLDRNCAAIRMSAEMLFVVSMVAADFGSSTG